MNEQEYMKITGGIDERFVAEYENYSTRRVTSLRKRIGIGIAVAVAVALMVPAGVFAFTQLTHRDKVSIYYSEEGVRLLEENNIADAYTVENGKIRLTVDVQICDGNFVEGVYTLTALTEDAKDHLHIPYVQASFVIQTLEYLHKGGRCSGLLRFGAAILRIKPQIIVSEGKMAPAKKYIGRKSQVVEAYCKDTLEQFANPDLSVAFVTHTHATPEMVAVAIEALKNRGFKTIYETTAGATITSHCGPQTLGILFINDGMQE